MGETIEKLLEYISKWDDDARILGNLKGKDVADELTAIRKQLEDDKKIICTLSKANSGLDGGVKELRARVNELEQVRRTLEWRVRELEAIQQGKGGER